MSHFPIDTIYHVITFLDHLFILKSIHLVSKDWSEAAQRIDLSLDFSIHKIHPHKVGFLFNQSEDETLAEQDNVLLNITNLSLAFNYIGNRGLKIISNCSSLTRLKHLNLRSNGINFEGIRSLAESKSIHLRSLNLRFNRLGSESLQVLASSENFQQLEELILYNTATSHTFHKFAIMGEFSTKDEGYIDIVESPNMSNLKVLNLRFCHVGNPTVISLATSQYMTNLTILNLQSNYIGNEGLKKLSGSEFLTNLTHLNLEFNCFREEGIVALARSSNFSKLRVLNLSNNYFGNGAQEILTSPFMSKLEILNLGRCRIGNEVLKVLVEKTCFLDNLQCFDLNHNTTDDTSLQIIANCPNFTSLTHLDIYPSDNYPHPSFNFNILFNSPFVKLNYLNQMTFTGIEILVPTPKMSNLTYLDLSCSFHYIKDMIESPFMNNVKQLILKMDLLGHAQSIGENSAFSNLTQLSMKGCNLNDEELVHILNSPFLNSLTSLNLTKNCIGDSSMKVLGSVPLVSKLKYLDLSYNRISDNGVQYLMYQPLALISISMRGNKLLTNTSLQIISQMGCNLIRLNMGEIPNITDDGILFIANSPFMRELQTFIIQGSYITVVGAVAALINLKLLLRSQKTFLRKVIQEHYKKK